MQDIDRYRCLNPLYPLDFYYLSFPKDKGLIKAVVYVTYAIEVLQTALASREAFRILGTGWGNPEVLLTVGLLGVTIPILVSICKISFWATTRFKLTLLLK